MTDADDRLPEISSKSAKRRAVARITLGSALVFAGVSHLTFAGKAFRAQLPRTLTDTVPFGKDDVS